MIWIEHTEAYGFEAAARGMRNPMNSWEKSDSVFLPNEVSLGDADRQLMRKLIESGTDHRKFLRMIIVWADVTAPLYWWKEADTYKVGTVGNSCSTMHKIHAKAFTLDDFSTEHLMGVSVADMMSVIERLNAARNCYLKTKDKEMWWQMIQLLPSSYNQKRTLMTNYEVLRSMYAARKAHKLDEWRMFCAWARKLPYSELITGETEQAAGKEGERV